MNKNDSVEIEERKGSSAKCPFCQKEFWFTKLVNWDGPTPFFYCNSCNDVLLRKSDALFVESETNGNSLTIPELEKIWNKIVDGAPACAKGGKFALWSNVHCPHCKKEIPYNNGVKNIAVRINEREIVVADGARVIGDSPEDSWQLKVVRS